MLFFPLQVAFVLLILLSLIFQNFLFVQTIHEHTLYQAEDYKNLLEIYFYIQLQLTFYSNLDPYYLNDTYIQGIHYIYSSRLSYRLYIMQAFVRKYDQIFHIYFPALNVL